MDNDKESALPASSSISTVQLEHADEKDMSGNHMDITLPLIPPLQARLFEYRGEHVAGFEVLIPLSYSAGNYFFRFLLSDAWFVFPRFAHSSPSPSLTNSPFVHPLAV